MSRLEYLLAATLLRVLLWLFSRLPVDDRRVVLATARTKTLEGNLAYIQRAMARLHPQLKYVHLLETYSYGRVGKGRYFMRLVRATQHIARSRLLVVDNAYLPIHVTPHRKETTVVQVWHAVGALKRFGLDTAVPIEGPERDFLHRYYDYVVVSSEHTRRPAAAALRTPVERVLALGSPRTDFFFDAAAMAQARALVLERYPALRERRIVLYAPTFRGRGAAKRGAPFLDAGRMRRDLPEEYALVLKTHPNLDPAMVARENYDVVADPAIELNRLLVAADILVTDYSSAVFEWALLRRPLVLLVGDLEQYERDPGLYIDYRHEMIGTKVADAEGVVDAVLNNRFDMTPYDDFITRHLGACDGRASERFARHFLG